MQKPHRGSTFADNWIGRLGQRLIDLPADMLEEVGIGPCSTVQMHVSRGRIIIQAVDEEACGGSRYCPCDCCEGCRG